MTTVEEIFGKSEHEVTEEEIRWYFDNCVGYPDCEEHWACALPRLPKRWEPYLWEKYTPEDVVKKYCDDYYYIMMFYDEALKEPNFVSHREIYTDFKGFFLESWKASMVLKWVEEGKFDAVKSHDLKKMYFDLATIELKG